MSINQLSNGKVYILENQDAKLVKVGKTNNDVMNRRIDINQMWLGTKGTCQVCGVRLRLKRINNQKLFPQHILSGQPCKGGNYLPLEKDSTLAKIVLEELKVASSLLVGNEKASNTRRINKIEERIKNFETLEKRSGVWKINTVYYTNNAEKVELLAHNFLSAFLKENIQFGEVFTCSVEEARLAIEKALEQLGLKEIYEKELFDK